MKIVTLEVPNSADTGMAKSNLLSLSGVLAVGVDQNRLDIHCGDMMPSTVLMGKAGTPTFFVSERME